MSPFAEFLQVLLLEGRAVLRQAPACAETEDGEAEAVLERFFADYRQQVAGSDLRFDKGTAIAAASFVHHACWLLQDRRQPETAVAQMPAPAQPPRLAAQHLAADLCFHLLPDLYNRARSRDPDDMLTRRIARLLREWPLSGVLSTIDEEPLTGLDFAGHAGLLLLYAERWCRREKPAWMPWGAGWQYLEMVWSDLGRDAAALPRDEQSPSAKVAPQ